MNQGEGERLKVAPLPGVTLGAVVTGANLAKLSEPAWNQILDAFHKHAVLIFPEQHLSPEAQADFGRRFGEIEGDETGTFDFQGFTIKNQNKKGQMVKEGSKGLLAMQGNESWHADSTYTPVSSKAGLLSAREGHHLTWGGATGFADMRAAYDALDQETREKVSGMKAYHSVQYSQAMTGLFTKSNGHGEAGNSYLRPLVKIHPVTQRPALFIARHAFGICGMSLDQSEEFLEKLMTDACQAPRTYEHTYKVGDLVVWDNRCILHRARPYDYTGEVRNLLGTRIAGDQTTERFEENDPESAMGREVFGAELERIRARFEGPNATLKPGNQHLRSAL